MDFSKFDSWIKIPPRTYKEYEGWNGEWDGITESHHAQVSSITIRKDEKEKCIGITFVERIDAIDVWRLGYAESLPKYILNNVYSEEDTDTQVVECAACFAPEKRVLGYFTDMQEAFEACDEAASTISAEVEDAIRNNHPSLYFSTYFLTNNYWPFGGERPEGDTGGTYTFDNYAQENEESNQEVSIEEEPKSFMDILCEMKSPAYLDYYELKAALIRDVCRKLDITACGVSSSDDNPYKYCGFFLDEEMFENELYEAYMRFLDECVGDTDSCYLILKGMQTEEFSDTDIKSCAKNAIINWVSMDAIQIDVLKYVYSKLGHNMPRF